MIETWMVSLIIAVAGAVGTYAVLRSNVSRLQSDFKEHITTNETIKKELHSKVDALFKKVDLCQDRVIVLERDTLNFLDVSKAEERFVSKIELELHLKNIELITKNTNKSVEKMEGKLEDLFDMLSEVSLKNKGIA